MSKAKIATNLLDRHVTMAPGYESLWAKSWVPDFDFNEFFKDQGAYLKTKCPVTASGTLMPAKIVGVWIVEDKIMIAAEMLEEPVADDAPNRGGEVREFFLSHVKLVPLG